MSISGLTTRPRQRLVAVGLVSAVVVALAGVAIVWVLDRNGTGGGGNGARAVTGSAGCSAPASSGSASPATSGAPARAGVVDVRSFGAVGDGVTDDAPAIRRALAAAEAVHVPAGTYLLGSFATPRTSLIPADFVFFLRDGQAITADPGAVFRMADGAVTGSTAAWGGNVFLANAVHDVSITGLTVDLDGARNLVPAGRTITGYGLYTYASQHVRLSGVTMRDTPGQNYVVAQGGGDDIRVERSTFRNGGTSIPANRNQTDFSALYFTATDVVVDGVTIEHDQPPFTYSGGVELHGSRESVTGSRIERSWPAVYIGPEVAVGGDVQRGVTVACNTFVGVGRGVVFNAEGTKPIDAVTIDRNQITLAADPAFHPEPTRAVDQDMPTGSTWRYHHVITGLTISRNAIDDLDGSSDAAVRLSQVHSADVVDNVMRGLGGAALELHSSPWGTTGVTFQHNDVGWRGRVPAVTLALAGSSTQPPVAAFTGGDITVARNRLALSGAPTTGCAVYATWNTGAGVSGIRVYDNTLPATANGMCGSRAAELQRSP